MVIFHKLILRKMYNFPNRRICSEDALMSTEAFIPLQAVTFYIPNVLDSFAFAKYRISNKEAFFAAKW